MQATIFRPNQEPLAIHRSHNYNFAIRQKNGGIYANINVVAFFLSVKPAYVKLIASTSTTALYTVVDPLNMNDNNVRNHGATVLGTKLFGRSEYYGTILIIDSTNNK